MLGIGVEFLPMSAIGFRISMLGIGVGCLFKVGVVGGLLSPLRIGVEDLCVKDRCRISLRVGDSCSSCYVL